MINSLRYFLSLLSTAAILAACGAPGTTGVDSQDEPLRVVVSLTPLANIVYNIAGDRIELDGILPPGVDPHTFEPRPTDAIKLAQADLIFVNGLHLDESSLKLAEANLKDGSEIVELAAAVAEPGDFIYGQEHHHGRSEESDHAGEEAHDDDEDGRADEAGHHDDEDGRADEAGHHDDDDHGRAGEEGRDDQGEPDPHLLLDPNFAIRYAKVVFVKLAERDPDNRAYYESNFNEYGARLMALDAAIRATTSTIPEENRRLLTYHDSFGYFARQYGYTVIGAIQPNDTSEPSAQEVAALIDQLLDEGVPAIFGSAQFPADVIEQIARETGAAVSALMDEDLPGEPGDPAHTYIAMMVENLRTLAHALGGDPSQMDGVEVGNVPDRE